MTARAGRPSSDAVRAVPAPFQVYVHVPFCARRCGYCDFNTYVAPAGERTAFADQAIRELRLVAGTGDGSGGDQPGWDGRPAATVFFGGGTPTLLPPADLIRLLDEVRRVFGLAAGAEVTVEANPDSVDGETLRRLADGGFTRVSFGMQSAVPRVLRTLDRTHDPSRTGVAVGWAAEAGLAASVDLIYGAPGETLADWERSVRTAIGFGLDHVSAYALTLEPHTPMARRIAAGELDGVDMDGQAEKYEVADDLFHAAGLDWYEISNWAVPGSESRHNLGYWTDAEWCGIGPGAHSFLGGERRWNVKSPRAYTAALARGESPVAGRDRPDTAGRELERVMLGLRTAAGVRLDTLSPGGREAAVRTAEDGLTTIEAGRLVLTRRGRLLADTVTRAVIFL